ncbi:ABC transporter substrate-binding protein [Geopsychrobacter electrodiphilus]|uniref:ABC transporter substrate-binding protein n=1 Tax=Geopsychrobacter electrodiphilus TaxID=225196 RepID=UPI0003634F38|nr:ABC transporter substrate-binding protein [Geopsychrobacter electrodiphilus]
MKKSLKFFCLAALVGCSLLTVSSAFAAKTIKVGIVDTYSGPASTYTNDVRDAFALAAEKINAAGGILGRQLEFFTRDSKFKVGLGLSAAKELVMRENVDILMGTINSSLALAISDFAKQEKIPFLATFAKSAKITGENGHRYVFSMNENTAMIGKAAAEGLAKRPYTSYWIAGDDYEYGHAVADGVWENLKKLKPGVKLLGQSWWKVGEPDFTPYITAILAQKPDAVIVATGGRDCVPFLKAAQATGFNKQVPFYMHTATEISTLKPLGLNAPEGVIGTANYHSYYPDTAENRAFVAEFEKAYGRTPAVGALYGYITAQFISRAYTKAGAIDTEKFINALEGLSVDSPVGKVTMRAEDHQVMLPMFMGVTTKAAGQSVLIAKDIVTIPAEETMPSLDEIRKARQH